MKKAKIILAVLACPLTSVAFATYTIDGNLSDWGVTPFNQWAPTGSAVYTQTDDINLYNGVGYSDFFDFEAMYFDSDATNFYVAVVTAHPLGPGVDAGDLGIDLNHDMMISPHGVVTGLEYAMLVGSAGPVGLGQVVHNPVWTDTAFIHQPDGWQGSPYLASGGTLVGSAVVVIQYDRGLDSGTYILEAAIPRSIFPNHGGVAGDTVGLHLTTSCGNDSINLIGTLTGPVLPPPPTGGTVPTPGALLLSSLGVGLIGWLRLRKGLI